MPKPAKTPFDAKVAAAYAARFEHILKGARQLNRSWGQKHPRDYDEVAALIGVWESLYSQWEAALIDLLAAIRADAGGKALLIAQGAGLFGEHQDALANELFVLFQDNILPLKTTQAIEPTTKPNHALDGYAPTVRQVINDAKNRPGAGK